MKHKMHVLSCQLTTFQVDDICTVGIKSYFIFRELQAASGWEVENHLSFIILYNFLFVVKPG